MKRSFAANKWLGASVLMLALSGCADFSGITPQSKMRVSLASNTSSNQAGDLAVFPQQQWWQTYHDAQLNALINQALEHSPTLKQAEIRLRIAQAGASEATSLRYPQVDASARSTRERLSENSIYPPPLGGSTVSMNAATISAQWQIDWFGKQRATLEAAIGLSRAAEADAQAAKLMLATQVVQQYFNLARLQAQMQIKQQLLHDSEQNAQLAHQRVAAGLDTALIERQAQAQIPQIRRDMAALNEQILIARHAMAVLIGAEPSATEQLSAQLPNNIDTAIPTEIPAELLGHRADVVAARWRAESEMQGIRIAKAAFYPNINLSAFIGFESIGLSKWFAASSRTVGAGPAISLPIFDAGRLRAQLRGRTAQTDAAIETYNSTVLNALREVADNLSSVNMTRIQLQEQQAAMLELNSAYDIAVARYKAGLSNLQNVLIAANAVLQQHSAMIDLQARICNVDASLMQALGGGYVKSEQPSALSNNSMNNIAKVSK